MDLEKQAVSSESVGATDCPICYEAFNVPGASGKTLGVQPREKLAVEGCDHEFCRQCLTHHCVYAVSVKEIPILCPAKASDNCANTLSDCLIEDLLCTPTVDAPTYGSVSASNQDSYNPISHSSDWVRFQRFRRQLQDPTLVSCTRCLELFNCPSSPSMMTLDSKPTNEPNGNQVSCPFCYHSFCLVHGDAHLGRSCEGYQPNYTQIRKSEKILRQYTKPCSHCGIPIQKESGCDHIVCLSCKEDMCFRCGDHRFLEGQMVRQCSQCSQNYIDHRYIWRYRLTLCLTLPFYLPLCILHIVVMAVAAVATCGCFCCLGCGVSTTEKKKVVFRPVEATRSVFAIVFLPAVDLARQCGVPCCCGLEVPGLEENNTSSTFDANGESEKDDQDDSEA